MLSGYLPERRFLFAEVAGPRALFLRGSAYHSSDRVLQKESEAYYSEPVTPGDIFAGKEVTNPEAQGMISEVMKMACTANC